jgi:hypothetical protein
MSVDERDLRMVLVAFEDAATWCEMLADLTDQCIATARGGRPISDADLHRAATQAAEARRYLRANRQEVDRIRERVGLT